MSLFTPIDNDLTLYDEIVSVELFSAITAGLNYLIDATPVGTIMPILYGLTGVPAPDSEIWQLCDGSAITNVNSPLVGHNTPDFTDGRMIKGAVSAGTPGTRGGSHTGDLRHNHGGSTSGLNWAPHNGQSKNDHDFHAFASGHQHTISSDSSMSAVNLDPIHVKIKQYIKIN